MGKTPTSNIIADLIADVMEYYALDNGSNKKALNEADKVLKKQKDLVCAKALRALALLRLGRVDECVVQANEVHSQFPTDEASLQAMSICYREMHKLERIADMYENANKMAPDSEEILSALFMAYVRIHNYKKQQQTAMKLHKLQPTKNPYYFWAVMSIVMQAQEADTALAKNMFLPLAERMTEKYAKDDKIEAEAEVYLYLMVLELLEKNEAAWELISGPLGEKLQSQPDFREIKSAEVLVKLNRWPEANKIYKKLLTENPDHWEFYKQYFTTLFQLIDSNYKPSPEENGSEVKKTKCDKTDNSAKENGIENGQAEDKISEKELESKKDVDENESETKDKSENETKKEVEQIVDCTVEMGYSFIKGQLDLVCEELRPIRGPYLAQMEFLKQLVDRKKGEEKSIEIGVDLLRQYYNHFGDKTCCHTDMQPYIGLADKEGQKQLSKELTEELFPESEDGNLVLPMDAKVMQQNMSLCTLARIIGSHKEMTVEARVTLVKELHQRYEHGLQFGKELLKTDQQYSDNYLLLAAHILHEVWQENGEQQYLIQAIVLLEKVIRNSSSNFQAKLLLIKLYCLLGAFGPCPTLYDSMEIKHIENDSLGYTVANHIGRLGHISSCCSLYETMLRFFTINHKETTEYLVQSYKYGSFTKIIEFVQFRDRLRNSFQYAAAKTERMLLDLTMETIMQEQVEKKLQRYVSIHQGTEQMVAYMEIRPEDLGLFPLGDLSDNRDMDVMLSWDAEQFDEEWQKYSFREEVAWLKVRNLTIRTLSQAVILSQELAQENKQQNNSIGNGEQDGKAAQKQLFEHLQKELTAKYEEGKEFKSSKKYPLAGPYRTRLSWYLDHGFHDMFLQLCDIVSGVHTAVDNKEEKLDKNLEDLSEKFLQSLAELTSSNSGSIIENTDGNLVFRADLLETLVLVTELIGHAAIFLGSCQRMIKPWKARHSKKSKKKKGKDGGEAAVKPLAILDYYTSLVEGLEKEALKVQQVFKALDETVTTMELESLTINDVFNQEDSPENDNTMQTLKHAVKTRVIQSYHISGSEMLTFLQNKLQYIQNLKR